MKSTGITRQVDELGRFVLPIEIRRALGIKVKDSLEIFTDEGRIILQKYQPACIFCANADKVHTTIRHPHIIFFIIQSFYPQR